MVRVIAYCPTCSSNDFTIKNNDLFHEGVICNKCNRPYEQEDLEWEVESPQ